MTSKKTLDDWLAWQETLMEETIVLGLDRVQLVYEKLFPNGVPFKVITVQELMEKAPRFPLLIVFISNQNIKWGALLLPTY